MASRSLEYFFPQPQQTPEQQQMAAVEAQLAAQQAQQEELRKRGLAKLGFMMNYGGPEAIQAPTQQMQRIADDPGYFLRGSDMGQRPGGPRQLR